MYICSHFHESIPTYVLNTLKRPIFVENKNKGFELFFKETVVFILFELTVRILTRDLLSL